MNNSLWRFIDPKKPHKRRTLYCPHCGAIHPKDSPEYHLYYYHGFPVSQMTCGNCKRDGLAWVGGQNIK